MEIITLRESNADLKKKRIEIDYKYVPVTGIKFCKVCGSEVVDSGCDNEDCSICGNGEDVSGNEDNVSGNGFITGELASRIGGYLRLSNQGRLKKYAKMRGISGVVKVSNKHVAWKLLVKDGFFEEDDEENRKIINKIYLKRWYNSS